MFEFLILLSGHFFADFPLQPQHMLDDKKLAFKTRLGTLTLVAHAFIHASILATLGLLFDLQFVFVFLVIGITHFFIDLGKIKGKYGVMTDQILHYLVIAFILLANNPLTTPITFYKLSLDREGSPSTYTSFNTNICRGERRFFMGKNMADSIYSINPTTQLQNNPGYGGTWGQSQYMLNGGLTLDSGSQKDLNTFLSSPKQVGTLSPTPVTNPTPNGVTGGGGNVSQLDQLRQIMNEGGLNPSQQSEYDALNQIANRENQIRSDINSGFDNIFGELDKQAGLIPGYETQDISSISNTADSLRTGIGQARAAADQKLDLTRGQIQTGVDKSVSDIGNSLRSLLKSSQSQIGSLGAGNSSAARTMLPYAFSKQYGRERGNIQGQANGQFTELGKKAIDVETTFNQQKQDLDLWENENLMTVRDKYRSILSDISAARQNAFGQRAQALSALQTQMLQNAQNELGQIRQNAENFRQQLFSWVADRSGSMGSLQSNIQQAGQYSASPISYNSMQGLAMGGTPQSSGGQFMVGSRRDERLA